MKIKICRKEAKESVYWLRLIQDTNDGEFVSAANELIGEANELKRIFASIVNRSS